MSTVVWSSCDVQQIRCSDWLMSLIPRVAGLLLHGAILKINLNGIKIEYLLHTLINVPYACSIFCHIVTLNISDTGGTSYLRHAAAIAYEMAVVGD